MRILKAGAVGLLVYLGGQGLAVALSFFGILPALLLGSDFGLLLSSSVAGLSYYIAIGVGGFLAGLPDRSRSAVIAIAMLLPAMVVPSMVKNAWRLHDVNALIQTDSAGLKSLRPKLPVTIALIESSGLGDLSQAETQCEWRCRELLISRAANAVIVAKTKLGNEFANSANQISWRLADDRRCTASPAAKDLLMRFRPIEPGSPPPPVATVSNKPFVRSRDPLDGCFVGANASMKSAQLAIVSVQGAMPPGWRGQPYIDGERAVYEMNNGAGRPVMRFGEVVYTLEGYPYWPKVIGPLGNATPRKDVVRKKFGDAANQGEYVDSLIREALDSKS
jgi:hypothetical protein